MTGFLDALAGGGRRARPLLPSFFEPFDASPPAEPAFAPDLASHWPAPADSVAPRWPEPDEPAAPQAPSFSEPQPSQPHQPRQSHPVPMAADAAFADREPDSAAHRPDLRLVPSSSVDSPREPRPPATRAAHEPRPRATRAAHEPHAADSPRLSPSAPPGTPAYQSPSTFTPHTTGPLFTPTPRQSEPHVTVSIGRIEVRAASPASEPAPRRRPERKPVVDLTDYLRGGATR